MRRIVPRGSFEHVTSLTELGVQFVEPQPSPDPQPYIFASKKSVAVDFVADADANLSSGVAAKGTLSARFTKTGSVYLAAIGCTVREIADVSKISVDLSQYRKEVIWYETFLVTSVTSATKALVMQSTSSEGGMTVKGDVQGLQPGAGATLSAKAVVNLTATKDASFIKPWSDNVNVFFGLHRFEKKTFGAGATERLLSRKDDQYGLVPVCAEELIAEDEEE